MLTLNLPGLATAGYRWTCEINQPDEAVVEVSDGGLKHSSSNRESEPLPVGSSGTEAFTIWAIQPGCARLHFVQRRSWEEDQPPLKEYQVEIMVQ